MTSEDFSVELTPRGFQQDCQEAMGRDTVRALVELITNSDDSYANLEGTAGSSEKYKIVVEVERRRKGQISRIIVRDRAEGMTRETMREALTKLGTKTSGYFKGLDRRGLLGRGAKDCAAFGTVTFQSIRDDRYTKLILNPSGRGRLDGSLRANRELREALGIPRGNGTVVTLEVEPQFGVPRHDTLYRDLPRHYALRDIMAARRSRELLLFDLNRPGHKGDHMTYTYPEGEVRFSGSVRVPGYPHAICKVVVKEHPTRFDEDKTSPYRQGGLLIKSGRATHDVTLFKFDNEPYAEWLFGEVSVPYIDTLIREFDEYLERGERPPEENPIRIISRRREGLLPEHPFTREMTKAIEGILHPIVEEIRNRETRKAISLETAELRRSLDRLGRAAAQFIDAEVAMSGDGDGGEESEPPYGLAIRPDTVRLVRGQLKVLSVVYRPEEMRGVSPTVQLSYQGKVIQLPDTQVALSLADDDYALYSGTFRVQAGSSIGSASVEASVDGLTALGHVEVVETPPPEPIEEMSFEYKNYRIAEGSRRTVRVFCPWSDALLYGRHLTVRSDHDQVVVFGHSTVFRYNAKMGCGLAKILVEGRQSGVRATLSAKMDRISTTAVVAVGQRYAGPEIKIELLDEDFGNQRAKWDSNILKIAGRHPSIRRYLGPAGENFPGRDEPHFRMLIAEIVAFEVARRIQRDRASRGAAAPRDSEAFYGEHYRLVHRFVLKAHSILLGPVPALA